MTTPGTQPPATPDHTEIYVGYLPVPRRLRRFLTIAVPALALLLVAAGVIIASTQTSPGKGEWDVGHTRTFTGTLIASPYPMLLADDAGDGLPAFVLLVRQGKHGAAPVAHDLAGRRVQARGLLIHRDARKLLELTGDSPLSPAEGLPRAIPSPTSLGRVTLKGEIIDPKCFLGAMKPGHGKPHKECATLCITGGIPPMFITRDHAGALTYYLLENSDGGPLSPDAYPFIADAVEIQAELLQWNGLPILRLDPAAIQRL
jgi:hypothetical protein